MTSLSFLILLEPSVWNCDHVNIILDWKWDKKHMEPEKMHDHGGCVFIFDLTDDLTQLKQRKEN